MSLSITLPDSLTAELQSRAQRQQLSVEDLAIRLLGDAVAQSKEPYAAPEEVVARIRATPPNSANIRPATGSLAEALENAPEDVEFDLQTWTREWNAVEAEMKAVSGANAAAEGRD